MARLNDQPDSEDELPDLFSILRLRTKASIGTQPKNPRQAHCDRICKEKQGNELATEYARADSPVISSETFNNIYSNRLQSRKQRPLGDSQQAYVDSLFRPPSNASVNNPRLEDSQSIEEVDGDVGQASPKRLANGLAERLGKISADTFNGIHHDHSVNTDLSSFMVPDSATDGESPLSKLPKNKRKKKQKQKYRSPKISTANPDEPGLQEPEQPQAHTQQLSGKTSLALPNKRNISKTCLESLPGNEHLRSELVEAHPSLDESTTLTPPRPTPRSEYEDSHHYFTPPCSSSIPKLKSPSKRHRIPPSPHRPSVDAFWSQDVVNDWNEQYSPRKVIESPRKVQSHSANEDEYLLGPQPIYESLSKSPSKSPAKPDKKILEQQKLFKERKQELAIAFLAEIDRTITSGQVASMADSTGGIRIIWSNKLSSTAGRANWRREVIRSKNADGFASNTFHRHYASIELAEKVIDDEDRLKNVIAHEYCHLANFMINGVKDNPHGKGFKEWARKCNNAFSHHGINVTTKHTYAIAYKYIWTCISPTCGLEYKRHSKSIDPSKHSCGNCKGRLIQVQPVPRKGTGEGKRSVYQEFVKQENQRVRLENPGATFGEIMSILGRDFKERKRNEAKKVACVEDDGALEPSESSEREYLDTVVRKLDFLDLSS